MAMEKKNACIDDVPIKTVIFSEILQLALYDDYRRVIDTTSHLRGAMVDNHLAARKEQTMRRRVHKEHPLLTAYGQRWVGTYRGMCWHIYLYIYIYTLYIYIYIYIQIYKYYIYIIYYEYIYIYMLFTLCIYIYIYILYYIYIILFIYINILYFIYIYIHLYSNIIK